MRSERQKARGLALDRERFEAVERLAVYEIVTFLLIAQLEPQRIYGLRAEEFQVFLLVVVATVQ